MTPFNFKMLLLNEHYTISGGFTEETMCSPSYSMSINKNKGDRKSYKICSHTIEILIKGMYWTNSPFKIRWNVKYLQSLC